jgi:hypothetical protein
VPDRSIVILSKVDALIGCLAIPDQGLRVIRFYTVAVPVHLAQQRLRMPVTLISGLTKPDQGFRKVLSQECLSSLAEYFFCRKR